LYLYPFELTIHQVKNIPIVIIIVLCLLAFKVPFAQAKWYKYPANPVFPPGRSDEWDQAKIAQTVLFEDGQYHIWYKGWNDNIPGFRGIGYASSPNGIHWKKYKANPLDLQCEGICWDTVSVAFDIVKKDSLYWMWYAGIDKKNSTGGIGLAWSENGLNWTKHPDPVLLSGEGDDWDGGGIYAASVQHNGINFHMWYNARDTITWTQRIGYATSDNGIHWVKHSSNPVIDNGEPGSWDDHSVGIYSVNFNGSLFEMWYDGYDKINTQIGYATSVDGNNWVKFETNPVLQVGKLGNWDTWFARVPTVVYHDSIYRMWYYGHDYSQGNIGYATSSADEAKSWDTVTINKPQTKYKVQLFNRTEYINVDSLGEILPTLSGITLIDAMNKLALAYSLNNSEKSLEFTEKALGLSAKENYPHGRAMALYSIGNNHYIQDNYSDALANQLSALWLLDSLDMQFEFGNLLSQIASIHSFAGSHDIAYKYYQQALDVFERLNNTSFIINSLKNLGYSYLENGDTTSAMQTFQKGLTLAKATDDNWIIAGSFEDIGICYSGHNLDSALFNFNEANIRWNHRWPEGHNLLITAEAYVAAGPEFYDEAETYFFKCFPLLTGKYLKVKLHLGTAELFYNTGRYSRSKEFLNIALDECQILVERQDYTMFASLQEKLKVEVDLKNYMEKIYRLYYRLDTVSNNKDLALKHFVLASQWKDSIINQQNKRQWAMLQGQYETEKAQGHIALLEKDNEVKNLTLKRSRIFLFGLGALVLITIVAAVIFIRNRRIRAQHAIELERVKSEKLQELDHLKSRFFANISHEFRTPLTLIMGPLEKLLSKTENKKDKNELGIAKKYAGKLQALINNLLTISKLESGKMQLHALELDIVKLVRTYLQAFESLAKQKDIELKFKSENEETKAFIDREKFEQVLNNLLSNAFKFTGEGGSVEVEVSLQSAVRSSQSSVDSKATADWRLKTEDLHGAWVGIKISDTGPGISPEHINHVFDRFYQAGNENRSYYEGTGIGLALTKELVELHHGKIKVESVQGKGSAFTIFLPLGNEHLKPEEIDTNPRSEEYLSKPVGEEESFNIEHRTLNDEPEASEEMPLLLIVEDNADMRAYIRGYFENDFQIIEAVDGTDGYEKSTEHIPDIIISDVMMPNMDGNEFCRKVKEDERTSHIPLILLTARSSKESRIEGLETGADDFITKPFDGDELQIRVKNLIDQRKRLSTVLERKIQKSHTTTKLDFDDSGITSMDERFLQKVIEVVKERHADPEFNTTAFGQAIGLGRIQLNRKIKALTGQTTINFIRIFRLNRAAELIKKKSATVAEIAYDVGFSSPSYFTECFRLHFGKLPSEFQDPDPV